jgi:hypothetical protein
MTLVEANGQILVWHDAAGRAPWLPVPALPELDAWAPCGQSAYRIRTRWREVLENAVDRAHFHVLHGYPAPPQLTFEARGPNFHMRSTVPWRRFGLDLDLTLDVQSCGPLVSISHGHAGFAFLVLAGTMPVDGEHVLHRVRFFVSARVPRPLRPLMGEIVRRATMREFERDIPIWENKVCVPTPVLCDADGPIVAFRTWAKQFHDAGAADRADAPAA